MPIRGRVRGLVINSVNNYDLNVCFNNPPSLLQEVGKGRRRGREGGGGGYRC